MWIKTSRGNWWTHLKIRKGLASYFQIRIIYNFRWKKFYLSGISEKMKNCIISVSAKDFYLDTLIQTKRLSSCKKEITLLKVSVHWQLQFVKTNTQICSRWLKMALPVQAVLSALWGTVCNKTSWDSCLYGCQLFCALCVQIRVKNASGRYWEGLLQSLGSSLPLFQGSHFVKLVS